MPLLAGCGRNAPARHGVTAAPGESGVAAVQSTAQFRLAEADYRKGRYLQAAALVAALERRGASSASQRDYLERQRAICLDAAASRKLARPHVPGRKAAALARTIPANHSPAIPRGKQFQQVSMGRPRAPPIGPHPPTPSPRVNSEAPTYGASEEGRALDGRRGAAVDTAPVQDCGPRALAVVCARLGSPISVTRLSKLAGTTARGTSMAGLARAAKALGFRAVGEQVTRQALPTVKPPAVIWVQPDHYAALLKLHGAESTGTATIWDPIRAGPQAIAQEELLRLCGGYLLVVWR